MQRVLNAMDALENGEAQGFVEGTLGIAPHKRKKIDLGKNYVAEYVFNNKNLNVHFYRSNGGLFPQSFRGRIYRSFSMWPGQHAGINIEWIDEMQSWCVTVVGGAELPPGEAEIEKVVRMVIE